LDVRNKTQVRVQNTGQYTSFSVQEDKKGILSEKAMQTGTIRQ